MRANLETLQKRREFLSRAGIVVLGALPASVVLIPRTALAAGCGVKTIALGTAGATITAIGAGFWTAPGGQLVGFGLMGVGVGIAKYSGVYKACIKPKLQELKEKIDKL